MTLPYRQERLLRRADHALRHSDPDLASMLSIFARLTAAEGVPAQEQLRPQRTWVSSVLLWPVAAAIFVVDGGSRAATACSAVSRALRQRVSRNPVTSAARPGTRSGPGTGQEEEGSYG
jgi:hypothetical protein